MSAILLVCSKSQPLEISDRALSIISERLAPDNITPSPPRAVRRDRLVLAVFDPRPDNAVHGTSACAGQMLSPPGEWWRPDEPLPDGCYALFRSDDRLVELAGDAAGSRTVWFIETPSVLVASTSQRAIVMLAGAFEPEPAAVPWMLSTGVQGPQHSWDRRIRRLPRGARFILNRSTWHGSVVRRPVVFRAEGRTAREHRETLRAALADTFNRLPLDCRRWAVLLSGGVDSRALLLHLKDRGTPHCVTWGPASSASTKGSDADIARRLAEYFGLSHSFHPLDDADESAATLFERFVRIGEGRIDHLKGYMDGFAVWKHLREQGYSGVVRGDEACGCRAVRGRRDVLRNMGFALLSEFDNLSLPRSFLERFPQERPPELEQRGDETLEDWRDRLNREYEIPVFFAALTHLKTAFLEVCNPLLSAAILDAVSRLPACHRTDKALFKKVVEDTGPPIPYTSRRAEKVDPLRSKPVMDFVREQLESSFAESLFGGDFVDYLLARTKPEVRLEAAVADPIRRVARRLSRPQILRLSHGALAMRACLICLTHRLLREDSAAISPQDSMKTIDSAPDY